MDWTGGCAGSHRRHGEWTADAAYAPRTAAAGPGATAATGTAAPAAGGTRCPTAGRPTASGGAGAAPAAPAHHRATGRRGADPAEVAPPTQGEVIVVTGSRIGDPLGKTAPVLMLSREDL